MDVCVSATSPWFCHLMTHAIGIGFSLLVVAAVWFYLPRPVKWLAGATLALVAALLFGIYRLLRRRWRPAKEA